MRLRRLPTTRLILVATSTFVVALALSSAAPGVTPAAGSIACPNGPAGWMLTGAPGRSALGATPSDRVVVGCRYAAAHKKALNVIVDYALPFNPNPYTVTSACTSSTGTPLKAPQVWNARDRLFRIVSSRAWSYAGFLDYSAVLTGKDVSGFEQVARTLLQRSVGLAETCTPTAAPVPLPQPISYLLHQSVVSGGVTTLLTGKGTFVRNPTATDPVGSVSDLSASDLVLTSTSPGSSQSLTLRVQKTLGYTMAPVEALSVSVQVMSSSYPDCGVGETGTATIATTYHECGCSGRAIPVNDATIRICGKTLLQGSA